VPFVSVFSSSKIKFLIRDVLSKGSIVLIEREPL